MPDHKAIYRTQAKQYERLVAREDVKRNILPALCQIRSLEGAEVVELGAGTGRLTCILAPIVKSIRAFDGSLHMLQAARKNLMRTGLMNWSVAVGDNRSLPVVDGSADVSIAGWSLGHFPSWYVDAWRDEIGRALVQMRRVLRPGGTAILLETLGTGRETPAPPHAALATYYSFLEKEHGFSHTWIRTDFRFESAAEAEELVRFFFGDDLADRVRREGLRDIPECTGIWWCYAC